MHADMTSAKLAYKSWGWAELLCTRRKKMEASHSKGDWAQSRLLLLMMIMMIIGVDLAGILGGRMASVEGRGRRGVPSQPTRGSRERREPSPSGVRPKTDSGILWRPQNAPFLYLYDKIWGGQFALASPTPNSGDLSSPLPRDLRPWWW